MLRGSVAVTALECEGEGEKRMKRNGRRGMWALALALCFLLSGFALAEAADGAPSSARIKEGECLHEHTFEQEYVDFEEGYVSATRYSHTQVGTLVRQVDCQDCWETLSRVVLEENVYRTTNHLNWLADTGDGYICCMECDYVIECAHPSWHLRDELFRDEDSTYGNITETTHDLIGKAFREKECDLCGVYFGQEFFEGVFTQPHDYDKDGNCACGKTRDCQHENYTEEGPVMMPGRWDDYYIDITETTHTLVGTSSMHRTCTDCGYDFYERIDDESVYAVQAHTLDEKGMCTGCGYIKSCDHANVRWYPGNDEEKYDTAGASYTDITATTHTAVMNRFIIGYCEDCGTRVKQVLEENCTVVENHDVADGSCTLCGYETDCAHANTFVEERCMATRDTSVDAETHESIPWAVERWVCCADCGTVLSGKGDWIWLSDAEMAQYTPEIAPHNFASYGSCSDCGYENPCTHPNGFATEKEFVASGYGESTTEQHTILGLEYSRTRCPDCGQYSSRVAQVVRNVSRQEDHRFVDGECNLCGYVDESCEHLNTYGCYDIRNISYSCEPANPRYHWIEGTPVVETYCRDCSAITSVELEPERRPGKHGFTDGVCDQCGYVQQSCAHEETETITYTDEEYKVFVGADAQGHRYQAPVIEQVVCRSCREVLSNTETGTTELTEPHRLDRITDTQCYCGCYENENGEWIDVVWPVSCTHAHTHVEELLDESVAYASTREGGMYMGAFYPVDADKHVLHMDMNYIEICDDCGMSVKRDDLTRVNTVVTLPHNFDGDICVNCAYVRQSAEPPVEPDDPYSENVAYLPASLGTIGGEALAGISARTVVIPSGATSIGARAFADCSELKYVEIPDSVTSIADDAFEGSTVTFICSAGSFAAEYAQARGISLR